MDVFLFLLVGVFYVDSLRVNGSTVLQSMETKTREPDENQREPTDKRTPQERSIIVGTVASSSPNQTMRRQRDDDDDVNAGDDDDYEDRFLLERVGKTDGVIAGIEFGRSGKKGTRALRGLEGRTEVGGGRGRGRKSGAREGKELKTEGGNRAIVGEEDEVERRGDRGIDGRALKGRESGGGMKRGGMGRGVGGVGIEIERRGNEERGRVGIAKGVERWEGGGAGPGGGSGERKSGLAAELGGGAIGETRSGRDGVSPMPSKQDRLRRQDNSKALPTPSAPTTTAFPSSTAPSNQSLYLSPLDFLDTLQNYPTTPNCAVSSTKNLPLDYSLPQSLYPMFAEQSSNLVQIANVLNNLFAQPGVPETSQSFHYKDAFYYSLVRAVVESHDVVSTAAIVFEKTQYETKDHPFGPFAYRNRTNGRTYTRHLSNSTQGIFSRDGITDIDRLSWLQRPSQSSSVPSSLHSQPPSAHSSKNFPDSDGNACSPPAAPLTTDSADRLINVSPVVTMATDGRWSRPHFDCASRTWLITFSVPFFSCADTSLNLKGVVKVDVDLSKVDINQCPNAGGIFQNTHKCLPTTRCVPAIKHGFRRGGYQCECLPGYYFPISSSAQGSSSSTPKVSYFNGTDLERHFPANISYDPSRADENGFVCLPCAEGCPTCASGSTCLGSDDFIVSMIALALQSFAMTSTLLAGVVIIRLRHTKVMKASFWLLLEIIILGALMMYTTVVIQYVSPSDVTCILVPWFREVGFVVVYGSLLLKVYRVLAEFQSRKAQRILLRDKDLLKYLTAMVTIVVGYMVTWTVINVDHIWKGATMVQTIDGEHRMKYSYCSSTWWDSVIEIEEFLFLLAAIYICYCIRSAPSFYLESKFISWAIYNETALSAIFNIVRHSLWTTVHPNYLYWMFFIRCQLTVTVTLLLVIGTKVWYTHRPPDDAICRRRTYSTTDAHEANAPEATKLTPSVGYGGGGGGGGLTEGEVADINLSEMNPDDIRAELKRLYTQLQIYKTKSMRKDNPHISKRRGGRKPTHRRFSLQAFHSNKHKLHQGSEVTSAEHENEASRSPEESTNSVDVVPGGGAGEGEGGLSGGGGGVEVIRARSTSLSSRAASVGHR